MDSIELSLESSSSLLSGSVNTENGRLRKVGISEGIKSFIGVVQVSRVSPPGGLGKLPKGAVVV